MTKNHINLYGDEYIPTTGAHGVNISQQRIDELDQACLDHISKLAIQYPNRRIQAMDIGGGAAIKA